MYDVDQGEETIFENDSHKEGAVIEGEDGPQDNKQQVCHSEPAESANSIGQ